MNPRKIFAAITGLIVADMLTERFILQAGEGDPTGFIPISEGLGLDEVVRAGMGLLLMAVADNVLSRIKI